MAALVQAMQGLGEIEVIAPEQNASGTSNALTLNRPLSVQRAANGFRYINGTPSDSVHVALTGLLSARPDLVLSGYQQRRQPALLELLHHGQRFFEAFFRSGFAQAKIVGAVVAHPTRCTDARPG